MAAAIDDERRDLPEENKFVYYVYMNQSLRVEIRGTKKRLYIRAYFRGEEYFSRMPFHRMEQRVCEWYFRMHRVWHMAGVHRSGITGTEARKTEMQYFGEHYAPQYGCGYHVYLGADGSLTSIWCVAKRNDPQIGVYRYSAINDVMPRFKRYPKNHPQIPVQTSPDYRFFIATRVLIVDTVRGVRDCTRCGATEVGGVSHLDESSILRMGLYSQFPSMRFPYFSIFLHKNAKLLFVDACRKCQFENIDAVANKPKEAVLEAVHHNRTLYQSGAFLIVEGYLCYQFAKYFDELYTASDLEERRIIPQRLITSKTSPLFFLRAAKGCDSIVWCLGPMEPNRDEQHWVLCIPDGGQFSAIEEYKHGINEVLHYQTKEPSLWNNNAIKNDGLYTRSQNFTGYVTPNACTRRIRNRPHKEAEIVWENIAASVPPPQPTLTQQPQHMPITEDQNVRIFLPLGTLVVVPNQYQLIGPTADYLLFARFSEYYLINKIWYMKQNTTTLPLILDLIQIDNLPPFLRFHRPVNRRLALSNDYFVLTYVDSNGHNYLVVEFYWDSYTNHIIRRQPLQQEQEQQEEQQLPIVPEM